MLFIGIATITIDYTLSKVTMLCLGSGGLTSSEVITEVHRDGCRVSAR
jgi:hypothetical protein